MLDKLLDYKKLRESNKTLQADCLFDEIVYLAFLNEPNYVCENGDLRYHLEGAFWTQALLSLFGLLVLIKLELPASLNIQRRRLREEIFGGLKDLILVHLSMLMMRLNSNQKKFFLMEIGFPSLLQKTNIIYGTSSAPKETLMISEKKFVNDTLKIL